MAASRGDPGRYGPATGVTRESCTSGASIFGFWVERSDLSVRRTLQELGVRALPDSTGDPWATTISAMQLRSARLCLNCEEIHEAQQCPVCASEALAYLTRWVPVPDGRSRPRLTATEEMGVYRRLVTADARRPKAVRLLKQGALALAAVSLARWIWRRQQTAQADEQTPDRPR
jgi:hypothetical protein